MRWEITKKEVSLTKLKQKLGKLKEAYCKSKSSITKGRIIHQIMLVERKINIKKANVKSGFNKKRVSIISVGNVGLSKK